MPEATLELFELSDLSPAQLEQERRSIIASLTTTYKGYDDPDVPRELLQKLAVITSALRKRNAGPPKRAKPTKAPPRSVDDLLADL